MVGLLALICIIKPYSGVDVKILVPIVYRAGDFHLLFQPCGINGRIIILGHTVYMVC